MRVNRNHFGRQVESFEADLDLPFLATASDPNIPGTKINPFHTVFIRAPIVEKILRPQQGVQEEEASVPETVIAPSKVAKDKTFQDIIGKGVEIMAKLPGRATTFSNNDITIQSTGDEGDIVAVRQGNVFATSFHPELTGDARIHTWWLQQVLTAIE